MKTNWSFSPDSHNASTSADLLQMVEDCNRRQAIGKCDDAFAPVTIDSIKSIAPFIENSKERTTDYTLGGIFMWIDYFKYEYAIFDGNLWLRGIVPETGNRFYHLPLNGKALTANEAEIILRRKFPDDDFGDICFLVFKEASVEEIDSMDFSKFASYSYGREYLYNVEQFTEFRGKKMEKKRNHLHQFIRNYPDYQVEVISHENMAEVIEFTCGYAMNRNEDVLSTLENEGTVEALRHYGKFPFDGVAIRVDGKIVAVSFGEKTGDTFCVHVEKGDMDYVGVYQAVSSEMAKLVAIRHPDVLYLNREEDMGDESLRKSKESYHPAIYILKNYFPPIIEK